MHDGIGHMVHPLGKHPCPGQAPPGRHPPGQAPPRQAPSHMGNERAVHILLECILVWICNLSICTDGWDIEAEKSHRVDPSHFTSLCSCPNGLCCIDVHNLMMSEDIASQWKSIKILVPSQVFITKFMKGKTFREKPVVEMIRSESTLWGMGN